MVLLQDNGGSPTAVCLRPTPTEDGRPKTGGKSPSLLISEHLFLIACLLISDSLCGDDLHGAQMTDNQRSQWKIDSVNPALLTTHFPGSLWKLTHHRQLPPASWVVFYLGSVLCHPHMRTACTKQQCQSQQTKQKIISPAWEGELWVGSPRVPCLELALQGPFRFSCCIINNPCKTAVPS